MRVFVIVQFIVFLLSANAYADQLLYKPQVDLSCDALDSDIQVFLGFEESAAGDSRNLGFHTQEITLDSALSDAGYGRSLNIEGQLKLQTSKSATATIYPMSGSYALSGMKLLSEVKSKEATKGPVTRILATAEFNSKNLKISLLNYNKKGATVLSTLTFNCRVHMNSLRYNATLSKDSALPIEKKILFQY